MSVNDKPTGLASLAALGSGDDFSVIDAIGGVRGVVESMLPGFVFVVMFVVSRDLKLTIIVSAVLAVLEVVVRLLQRQTVLGALSGLIAVAICLVWAWNTHEARNYYVYGFITNSVYLVALAFTLAIRVPGVGFLVEFIRSMPTLHFRDWLADWRGDRKLYKAYVFVTALWMCLFALRLAVQVPLYLTNHVTWLGTTRLLMGLPFWALAIWVSYLLIADPIRHHPKFVVEDEDDDESDDVEDKADSVDMVAVDSAEDGVDSRKDDADTIAKSEQ
ncbi:DUF3159 domain-containing protein [Bifidobacterium sp. ESL0790]|uniref:DUF3159 domain-containing protein n=1 Tax=Bifidobacterium sp. ESL0790 TaxID=2983233 RepID=UPI0023F708F3|nr:DUF3159 domain-containing protein [Bifidobacterium sp. ESL0790]WEV72908.1 DUF3159 domain-containing protein [Bifidobacterium sp. ESL0790]